MRRNYIRIVFMTIFFLGGQFLFSTITTNNTSDNKKSRMPEELVLLTNNLLDLDIKINAIDEYAPEKSPDFKNLQKINQLVDELEFNKRKFDLLISKYKLIEKKILGFLLEYSKNNKDTNKIIKTLKQYFQKSINNIALKIERLKRDISRIQLNAKTIALKSGTKGKSTKALNVMSISERIQRFKDDFIKLKKELTIEEKLLRAQNEAEDFQVKKIKEKSDEINILRNNAKTSKNLVHRTIFLIKARVIRERLNGLETPKLNTIKAHTYLIKTKIDTLKEKITKNINEQKLLEKIRKKELIDNVIKSVIIIIIALIFVLILIKLSKYISLKILKRVEKSEKFDAHKKQRYNTLSSVLLSFSRILIWTAAVFWILGELEVDYGPFLVAAGGISLAIGFGAQSLVKDIVTGFFLLIEEQFALGDFVEINGKSGTVEKISLRTIRFRSLDGTVHIIPNGNISNVSNSSYRWSRAVVKIGVSYNEDTAHVLKALKEASDIVYNMPALKKLFLEEPSIQGILAFNDSSVMYRVIAKTESGEQWGIEREINKAIKKVFDRENIEIPYNYINVVNIS